MIPAVAWLALSSVVFVEQPLDRIEVTVHGYGGEYTATWRCADIDRDGATDIVTPVNTAFQRDNQFPKAQQAPFPDFGESPLADVWGGEIYLLLRERVEVLRWADGVWQRTLSQPMAWPANLSGPADDRAARALRFERFLVDLNGDKRPEILRLAPDGVHIFAKPELFYEAASVWNVMPPANTVSGVHALWPETARTPAAPVLDVSGKISVRQDAITVLSSSTVGGNRARFDHVHYPLGNTPAYSLAVDAPARQTYLVDRRCVPVTLNQDAVQDFLSVSIIGETAPPLSSPIIEVRASTDGGKNFHTAQCTGAMPRQVLTDYNNDERLDLVTDSKRLVEGGIKETLMRGLTRREVDVDLEVRLQDEQGSFPAKASFLRRFSIELDKPPVNQSAMFLNFLQGRLISLDGDFDGDGTNDLAVHDRPTRISVYRGTSNGITGERIGALDVSSQATFAVADVDQDGKSDLVIALDAASGADSAGRTTVYLAREGAP